MSTFTSILPIRPARSVDGSASARIETGWGAASCDSPSCASARGPSAPRATSAAAAPRRAALRQQFDQLTIGLRTAVPIELPDVPHLADHVEIEVGDQD